MVLLLKFQNPFNVVTYSIIGDDNAPNLFFITPQTGLITLSNTVNTDNSNVYRVGNSKCVQGGNSKCVQGR